MIVNEFTNYHFSFALFHTRQIGMCAHYFPFSFLLTAVEEINLRCNVSMCVRKGMCHFQKKKEENYW